MTSSQLMPVEEALRTLLEGVEPLDSEIISLSSANGRVLAEDLYSTRTQPPFSASAMDGYAVRAEDVGNPPASLEVIGEAPAGHAFQGTLKAGQAVRIFTGAPVPEGADTVVIQENTQRQDNLVTVLEAPKRGANIRKLGLDFHEGQKLLRKGDRLDFRSLSLAASMNHPTVPVVRKPRVAILATGDELVTPGTDPKPDQIIASNQLGLTALVEDCGGIPIDLGIAIDDEKVIGHFVRQALTEKADILVTLGGASVGDHDLIHDALGQAGMNLAFWKIAMRPGKPLMAGHIGNTKVLGLPGNPVSSLVCALLFLRPLLARMSNLTSSGTKVQKARLTGSLPANDHRQDYVRAKLHRHEDGTFSVTPFSLQDSSLLGLFSQSSALIIRTPYAQPASENDQVDFLPITSI
ncbi:MAG: molybdopterin molybdotransferase MoeA [Rhodobacteraceae bacterium]|nr:molybdopterin molybdotransferase MoeA [Paracoccaceae bacterium]